MRKLNLTAGVALLAVVLPSANVGADEGTVFVSERAPREATMPYEDTEFDRNLPTIAERMGTKRWTIGESPAADKFADEQKSASAGASAEFGVPWQRDHHFIAPAQ